VPVEGRREPGVEPPEGCDGDVELVESAVDLLGGDADPGGLLQDLR
jgi:hypothetical protein